MDNYAKRTQLYTDCLIVLKLFNSPKEEVLTENVSIRSLKMAIEDVLLDINAIEISPLFSNPFYNV